MALDPVVTGAIIAGGAGLLGGYLGSQATGRANESNETIARENMAKQEEFAKHGIRWRVEDAVAAGLHPLAALGAQGPMYSPVQGSAVPDLAIPNAMSSAGQDISRAVSATQTAHEREFAAIQLANAKADLDGRMIDNQIKASQLKRLNMSSPAMPSDADNFIPGQGNSGLVRVKPAERTASQPGRFAQEAGWRPDVSFSRTDTGLAPMVPEALSESLEDDFIGKLLWRFRNQIVPNTTGEGKPARSQLPRGYDDWQWHFGRQEWQPVRGKSYTPYQQWYRLVNGY